MSQDIKIVLDPKAPPRNIHELDLQPLDLLAFRGGDTVSNILLKLEKYVCGNGDFSHVGLLVNRELIPDVEEMEPGKWYVWESTISFSSTSKDIETHKGRLGVQLRELESVIKSYTDNGKNNNAVTWCKLLNNPWRQAEIEGDKVNKFCISQCMMTTFEQYQHNLYQVDAISMVASLFPQLRVVRNVSDRVIKSIENCVHKTELRDMGDTSPRGSRSRPRLSRTTSTDFMKDVRKHITPDDYHLLNGQSSWKFCSELVADVYQQLGLFPFDKPTNDVVPVDFFGDVVDGIPPLVEAPVTLSADFGVSSDSGSSSSN